MQLLKGLSTSARTFDGPLNSPMKQHIGNFLDNVLTLWNLSWIKISYGFFDLTLIDMIKKEFEGLFGSCKSYLYVVIFKKDGVKKKEK